MKIDFFNIFCLLVIVSIGLGVWAGLTGKFRNFRGFVSQFYVLSTCKTRNPIGFRVWGAGIVRLRAMFKLDGVQMFCIIPAVFLFLLLVARTFCQPLMSPDSVFRWNYLAVKIFETGGFGFYPPMSAEDFKLYFYVDGIPPLVQFSYYWLYASFGSASEVRLSVILIAFQYVSIVFLCYYSASHIFQSSKAGIYSVLLLLSSTIFFFSLFLGQETGLTALSMAATIYFLSGADGEESASNSVLAGFSTALGALSREYGLAFIVIGLLICFWRKRTGRNIFAYLLSSSLLCASWYIYLYLRTGNPVYSLSIGTLFPVNEIFDGIYKTYVIYFGLGTQTLPKIKFIINLLLTLSPMHLLLLPALFLLPLRKVGYLLAAALIFILIWLNSIGYTCGGFFYSSRTLSPLIVVISIAAGGLISRFSNGKPSFILCGVLVFIFVIWVAYRDLCIPANTSMVPPRFIYNSAFGKLGKPGIVNYADIRELPGNAKVLSDSALHHGALMTSLGKHRKIIDFVPVWSPEVAFLSNPENTYAKTLSELRHCGIKYVLYSKNSYNNAYLEKYLFFREYRNYSKAIYEDASILIYLLPDVNQEK
jgi:hypothetical protein